MFVDARELPAETRVDADLCVIGAGPAGIAIAKEFIGTSSSVCLLESGGLDFDADTQALCRGENTGFPYYDLDIAQLRRFGGATGVWSGVCRPLDEIYFEARAGLPLSGWPFDKTHLDPFYRRAHEMLKLSPYDYSLDTWDPRAKARLPLEQRADRGSRPLGSRAGISVGLD